MYEGPARLFNGCNIDVIDVGCSGGYGYTVMVNENILNRYYGVDNEPSVIEIHKSLLISENHTVECTGWLEAPPPFIADIIFCIEVLEHVPQDRREAFIDKCAKYTKNHMFLSTPKNGHGKIQHCGLIQPSECTKILQNAGFNVMIFDKQWTTLYICEKSNSKIK